MPLIETTDFFARSPYSVNWCDLVYRLVDRRKAYPVSIWTRSRWLGYQSHRCDEKPDFLYIVLIKNSLPIHTIESSLHSINKNLSTRRFCHLSCQADIFSSAGIPKHRSNRSSGWLTIQDLNQWLKQLSSLGCTKRGNGSRSIIIYHCMSFHSAESRSLF